jgi:hypothetical protein
MATTNGTISPKCRSLPRSSQPTPRSRGASRTTKITSAAISMSLGGDAQDPQAGGHVAGQHQVPFGRLVAQVMTVEPYSSAKRVFWVVDNGSSHRGKASVDRLQGQWPTLRLVHLPVHAPWLNQIEIYFSVVQRKVVSPNDFTDLAEVKARLLAFECRYQQTAAPFDLRFTRSDLDRLPRRLDDHEQLP